MVLRAALLLLGVAIVLGQDIIGTLPEGQAACDMSTLSARVEAVNSQCQSQCGVEMSARADCGYPGITKEECVSPSNPDKAQGETCCWADVSDTFHSQSIPYCYHATGSDCTVPCASVLLPLLDACRPILDALLDNGDGVQDGVARQLDDLHEQCLQIPEQDVLMELKGRVVAETCSSSVLNGVAQTAVTAAPCADSGQVECGALIIAGLKCKDSTMVANCAATCDRCERHRRAQLVSACPLKDFDNAVDAVNTACCDYEGCSGVPTTCDAKCAIVFNDFFDRCSNILNMQMADQIDGFTDLHNTCATQLPVEPLLRTVIECDLRAGVGPNVNPACLQPYVTVTEDHRGSDGFSRSDYEYNGGWVRFPSGALPTAEPAEGQCDAVSGWWSSCDARDYQCNTQGVLPSELGGIVEGIICFPGGGRPCDSHVYAAAVNCGGFMLYRLPSITTDRYWCYGDHTDETDNCDGHTNGGNYPTSGPDDHAYCWTSQ